MVQNGGKRIELLEFGLLTDVPFESDAEPGPELIGHTDVLDGCIMQAFISAPGSTKVSRPNVLESAKRKPKRPFGVSGGGELLLLPTSATLEEPNELKNGDVAVLPFWVFITAEFKVANDGEPELEIECGGAIG